MSTVTAMSGYPLNVNIRRPRETYGENGSYEEAFETVAERMPADIQLSLKIRSLKSENGSGFSDRAAWLMFAEPPVNLLEGDHVSDGERNFIIEAVGDWGSHVECVMRKV
jgi:hypothetical protein